MHDGSFLSWFSTATFPRPWKHSFWSILSGVWPGERFASLGLLRMTKKPVGVVGRSWPCAWLTGDPTFTPDYGTNDDDNDRIEIIITYRFKTNMQMFVSLLTFVCLKRFMYSERFHISFQCIDDIFYRLLLPFKNWERTFMPVFFVFF